MTSSFLFHSCSLSLSFSHSLIRARHERQLSILLDTSLWLLRWLLTSRRHMFHNAGWNQLNDFLNVKKTQPNAFVEDINFFFLEYASNCRDRRVRELETFSRRRNERNRTTDSRARVSSSLFPFLFLSSSFRSTNICKSVLERKCIESTRELLR